MTRRSFLKALSTSATDTSFPSRIPTATRPSTAIENQGDTLTFAPYGEAANDDTFDLRVIGWSIRKDIWIPTVICQLACTHCTAVGLANRDIVAAERFCDAITLTNGIAVLPSVPANTIATATVDIEGFDFFEFTFDLGAGANANALILPSGEYSL